MKNVFQIKTSAQVEEIGRPSDSKISCLFALFDVILQDREKAILICFCWASDEGKLKRLVYSHEQTDVTEIVFRNTEILKEFFSFLFFLYSISILRSVILLFFSSLRLEDTLWDAWYDVYSRWSEEAIACSLSSSGQPDHKSDNFIAEIKAFCRYQYRGSDNAFITKANNKW